MPPRYAYWTIIVDSQPTAFRSGTQEELMPTFKRLKAKNDSAVMMWWQNGKLWPSRVDAQETMIGRGDAGRRSDPRREGTGFRDRERKPTRERSAWTPRGEPSTPAPARTANDKLDWKPKGEFVPAPKRADRSEWSKPERSEKPNWKPQPSFDRARSEKPEWKPKGEFTPAARRTERSDWKSEPSSPQAFKPSRSEKPEWKPKSFKRPDYKPSADQSRSPKPEWKPKGSFDRESKPDWKPKASFDRERKPDWKSKPSSGDTFKPSRSQKPEWKPKGSFTPAPRRPAGTGKPEWKPRDDGGRFAKPDWKSKSDRPEWKPKTPGPQDLKTPGPEKRKWVPKEEYKRSMGIEAKRDAKWRPGGEHKDPRQKFKDAKKAKWSKFKQNIRARSGGKGKKSS